METTTANNQQCAIQPSLVFLLGTLLLTSCATAMLCAAVMTDHWEYVSWDQSKVEHIARTSKKNLTAHRHIVVEWYLDGYVTRIAVRDRSRRRRPTIADVNAVDDPMMGVDVASVFLVPMNGGIWTLCVSLTEQQIRLLSSVGFSQKECINYLAPVLTKGEEARTDWQHRMQNLSISCALVCLIILASSALVGAFGIFQHQISAVLVTGVMYLLAATFALFTLTIIHFKRQKTSTRPPGDCTDIAPGVPAILADGVSPSTDAALGIDMVSIWAEYYSARIFKVGWSLDLGWGGVTLCVLTSVLWILLSKIMRYNPLTSTMLS
uniref:Uncharacterized protein n=1 Tax=Clastoptera arizonana TaxID=38151 RepID=A0A1B6DGP9_9HEMI